MSYDVIAECPCGCPNCKFRYVDWNYTSNMSPAWREAGVDLAEFQGKTCGELADALVVPIDLMDKDRDEYAQHFDSPNGWGSIATLIPALKNLRHQCNQRRDAYVEVSR